MKSAIMSAFLVLLFSSTVVTSTEDNNIPVIVSGSGWGKVVLGASRTEIAAILGKGKLNSQYDDVYFVDYIKIGIQVSFLNKDNKANAIFFYNKQKGSEYFASFQGKTSKGIAWTSSVEDIEKAYGKPLRVYQGNDDNGRWKRIVYKQIDFSFENEKMVRISVYRSEVYKGKDRQ